MDGTYLELRKFINLLELSDSFLTLEEVTLAGETRGEGPELNIRLSLSTLFASEEGSDEATAPPAALTAPATPTAPAPGAAGAREET